MAIYIYDLETSELERILTSVEKNISAVHWNPHNENQLIYGCIDKRIVIWDLEKDTCCLEISGLPGIPTDFSWHPSNPDIVTIALEAMHIYHLHITRADLEVASCRDQAIIKVSTLQWNPKRPHVLVCGCSNDHLVTCLDYGAAGGIGRDSVGFKRIFYGEGHVDKKNTVSVLAWDPLSANYLCVGYTQGSIVLYDMDSTTVIANFASRQQSGGMLRALAWCGSASPGGFLSVDDRSGTLKLWNVAQANPMAILPIRKCGFQSISFVGKLEMQLCLCSFTDGTVGVYALRERRWRSIKVLSHSETVFTCAFSPANPNILATGSFDGTVKIWDVTSQVCLQVLPGHGGVVFYLAWHPEGEDRIMAAISSGEVWIWDIARRQVVMSVANHAEPVYCCAWNSGDPSLGASVSRDGNLVVFAVKDGSVERRIAHPVARPLYGVHFNVHNKRIVATASADGIVRIWDIGKVSSAPVLELKGHGMKVFHCVWSSLLPNYLLTSSDDHTLRCWNISSGECRILRGHTSNVRAVCWSSEVPWLCFSGSWDGTVRAWDIRRDHCVASFTDHHADVYGLSLHPSRPFVLASSSRDTTVRILWLQELILPICMAMAESQSIESFFGTTDEAMQSLSSTICLCGPGSKRLRQSLKSAGSVALKWQAFCDFFLAPSRDVWEIILLQIGGQRRMPLTKFSILHASELLDQEEHRHAALRQTADQVTASGAVIGLKKKEVTLKELSLRHLRMGNVRASCECLVEMGEWDKALALAPGVSLSYWKGLWERQRQTVTHEGGANGANGSTSGGNADFIQLSAAAVENWEYAHLIGGEVGVVRSFYMERRQFEHATTLAVGDGTQGFLPLQTHLRSIPPDDPQAAREAEQHARSAATKAAVPLLHLQHGLLEVRALQAEQAFAKGESYESLALYLSCSDVVGACSVAMRAGDPFLAIAVASAFQSTAGDQVFVEMAAICEAASLWKQAVHFLSQSSSHQSELQLIMLRSAGIEHAWDRLGSLEPAEYLRRAEVAYKSADIAGAVRAFLLGDDRLQAITVGLQCLGEYLSQPSWRLEHCYPVIEALTSIPPGSSILSVYPVEQGYLLMCYSYYIGAIRAAFLGYLTIARAMYALTLDLLTSSSYSISFPIATYAVLWEFGSFMAAVDHRQARRILKELLKGSDTPPDYMERGRALLEMLQNNDFAPLSRRQQRRYACVPLGSTLPCGMASSLQKTASLRSVLSHEPIFGGALLLDDGVSKVSQAEAWMWRRVCQLSPLKTGYPMAHSFVVTS
jgi:WD repeat-containing protein 17